MKSMALERCGCGRGIVINFNGESFCVKCYQDMLKSLPRVKKVNKFTHKKV